MSTPTQLRSARAVADVNAGTILASVEIAAPPERVYRALTSPEEIVKWWGADGVYKTTGWTSEPKPGGRWRAEGVEDDGSTFHVEGEYVELDPPHRIVCTWKAPWDAGNVTTVTYRLEPIEGGTRVVLRHDGFTGRAEACRQHGAGWELVLGWLGAFLAPPPGAERFYLIRLLPPRPTFPMDMTPAEKTVMEEHVVYWRDKLARGKAVVFGPVADPKGAWGLGVVRIADDAELRAFEAGDPAIRANRGFSYEVLPMPQAVAAG